ncbi:MAG: uroporphyrinogen-III C-methyltransferase [Thermodesulfobacteriota bacterium]
MKKKAAVYLIGAGPGDKDLITLKGKKLLESADVIIYDYLVNSDLLRHAKKSAEVIYVGKKAGQKEMPQKDINTLLASKAKSGRIVARLKGGDPTTFGRGGEEAQALRKKKIPFEIVPGVSSVSAVPAYAGISLTHRDFTSSFAVVTGHEDPTKKHSNIEWDALSKMGTIVFLMGVQNLKKNMTELIKAGKDPKTPAAVITWGTYPKQRTLTGTIENIYHLTNKRQDITSPAVIVVGEVVKLREIINWYESKPLFGKNIVVTRPLEQSDELINELSSQGANVIHFPTIEIAPPRSYKSLDRAIKTISDYDWIIFTSVNGVKSFFNRLRELNKDIRSLHKAKIAAIGSATCEEINQLGLNVDIIPDEFKAEGLISKLNKKNLKNSRVLIPRAKVARDVLPENLKSLGAKVDVVTAYITKKPPAKGLKQINRLLSDNKIDLISFTSSSTAKNFFELIPNFKQTPSKPLIASIGPITAKTVKEYGYKSQIIPKKYTALDLSKSIKLYFKNKNLK